MSANTFSADLVAALTALAVVEAGNTAKIPTKSGGEFSYQYADLSDVVRLTRPALAEHGIIALTPVHAHEQGLAVTVHLLHKSGEELVFEPLPFPAGRDPQSTGSAITYHRRYALLAALGIAAGDDDDDGQAATKAGSQPRKPPKPPESEALTAARAVAHELGDSAVTVVPSVVLEVTGREAKLADLTDEELGEVTAELQKAVEAA